MMWPLRVALVLAALLLAACPTVTVKTEPIEVKPIDININVTVKIDRQLDEFFDFENKDESGQPAGPEKGAKP